jgi:hypothetical protein
MDHFRSIPFENNENNPFENRKDKEFIDFSP